MKSETQLTMAGHLCAEWRVLLIEDTPTFQMVVTSLLEEQGFQTLVVDDGRSGLEAVQNWQPDLVLLDLGLPDMDGMAVCEQIRQVSDAFIVMLTGRADDESRFSGLQIGADAFVVKPFDSRELLLAIEVLLRRSKPRGGLPDLVELGRLTFDRRARRVSLDGGVVHLTNIELSFLELLASAGGDVVTRTEFMTCLWGPNWTGDDHGISVHMANLRKKIDPQGLGRIETVRGVGYRLHSH